METRNRILDCAERVFGERGVSRTSLQDVAEAAGVTRGAIYWHFQDKADLFSAMLDRVCLPIEDSISGWDAALADDPLGALRKSLQTLFARVSHDDRARRVFEIATHKVEYVDELTAVRERRMKSCADYLALTERALRAAKAQGSCHSTASPKAVAIGLHALVDGLIANWTLDSAAFNLERVGRIAVDNYLAGFCRVGIDATPAAA